MTFTPSACGALRASIIADIEHSDKIAMRAVGDVQAPDVTLIPQKVDLNVSFVRVKRTATICLENSTNLPTMVNQ